MGDIRAGIEEIKLDSRLFAEVIYYVSGEADPKILNLLQEGGAERCNYFSDYVSHLIAGFEALESDLSEAKDIYQVPAVTQEWILYSAKCRKLLPTHYFSVEEKQLFSNVKASISQVSRADSKALWAMITLQGGKCQLRLDGSCTHLIVSKASGAKYEAALRHQIPVVTPDWVVECCRKGGLVGETEFHPRLLVYPSPNSSTALITGFMDEEVENNISQKEQERNKAMLEQLKQRMPWNQQKSQPVVTSQVMSQSQNVISTTSPGPIYNSTSTQNNNVEMSDQSLQQSQQQISQPQQGSQQQIQQLQQVQPMHQQLQQQMQQPQQIMQQQQQIQQSQQQIQQSQQQIQQPQQQIQQSQQMIQQSQQQQLQQPQQQIHQSQQQVQQLQQQQLQHQMQQPQQQAQQQIQQPQQQLQNQMQQQQLQQPQQQLQQQMQQQQQFVWTSAASNTVAHATTSIPVSSVQNNIQQGGWNSPGIQSSNILPMKSPTQQEVPTSQINAQGMHQPQQLLNQQQELLQMPQQSPISQQQNINQQAIVSQQQQVNTQMLQHQISSKQLNNQQQLMPQQQMVQQQQQQQMIPQQQMISQQQIIPQQQIPVQQQMVVQQPAMISQAQQQMVTQQPAMISQAQQQVTSQTQMTPQQQMVQQPATPQQQIAQQPMASQQQMVPQQMVQQQQMTQQQMSVQQQMIPQQQVASQQQLNPQQHLGPQQQIVQQQLAQQQMMQQPITSQQQLVSQQQMVSQQQIVQQPMTSQQQMAPQQQMAQQTITSQQQIVPQQQIVQQQQITQQQLTNQQQLLLQKQQLLSQQVQQLNQQSQQMGIQQQSNPIQKQQQQLMPEQCQQMLLLQQQQKIQQISQQLQQSAPQSSQQFIVREGQVQQQSPTQMVGPNQQGFMVQRDAQWQQQQYQLQLQRQQQQQQIAGQQRPGTQWPQQTSQPPRQLIQLDAQTHQQLQQMDPQQRAQFIQKLQKHKTLFFQRPQQRHQQGPHIAVVRSPGKPGQPGGIQWVSQPRPQLMGPQITGAPGQKPAQMHPVAQQPPIGPNNQVVVQTSLAPQGTQQVVQNQQFPQGQPLTQQQIAQIQMQKQQQQIARMQQLQQMQQQQQVGGQPQEPGAMAAMPGASSGQQIPTDQQLVVNAKTKTALANMLTSRLQSGTADGSAAGQLRLMTAQQRPPPPASQDPQLLAAYQRRTLGNITNGASPGSAVKMPGTSAAVQQPKAQFYGHNPNLKLPPDLFLLGCIFVIVEYDTVSEEVISWKQVIEKHGGEIEPQYCARATHILAMTLKHPTVIQGIRDNKRCITAHWLSDVVSKQQVLPPWHALHFPLPFSVPEQPCTKQIVSLSGFEGEERAKVKFMLEAIGAKFTKYFSRHNTLLICKRPEGPKYKKAREWQTGVVNAQWLTDLLCGHMPALHQMEASKYQQYSLGNPFRLDYSLVPHLMAAWKMPINITQESYDKVKQVGQGPNAMRKYKKPKLEVPLSSKDPQNLGLDEPITISNPNPPSPEEQPKILFSGINPKKYAKRIRELGGTLASSWKDATHLVMNAPLRTVKFLCCLSHCKYIVSLKWLLDCLAKNTFVEESAYTLNDPEFEKNFSCNIEKALASPNRGSILKGKIFYVTPSVVPSPSAMTEIIESAGGTVEKQRKSLAQIQEINNGKIDYVIITVENDLHLLADVLRADINVYSAEIVLGAIAKQSFQLDPPSPLS